MGKPIYWGIGAALAFAIVWVVARNDEPAPMVQSQVESADAAMRARSQAGLVASADPDGRSATSAPVSAPAAANQEMETVDGAAPASPGFASASHDSASASPDSESASPDSASALPIDVTPGFDFLNTKANTLKDTDARKPLLLRHEELQAQPRDPTWSEQMEAALRKGIQDSLIAHGMDGQRVELPVVECRSTGCEIQAIGFREDNGKPGVDIQSIIPALLLGPLNRELDNPHGTMQMLPDGRLSYIVLLGRRGR